LKNGVDIGKAIALGADLGGLARPFLTAAVASEAAVDELVTFLIAELEIALFCTGNANLSALKNSSALQLCQFF
jgi:isopentenyl-diphosphate delta-isomerase